MGNINNGVLDGTRRVIPGVRSIGVNSGLAGAPLGMRHRGATAGGPPAVGSWKAGDQVTDRGNGAIWVCTATGTPGTWAQAPGLPVPQVTVSPIGLSTAGVTSANNGATYGPDTAGTVTCGIQEAINLAVAQALGAAGAAPDIVLLPGKFPLSTFANSTYRSVLTVDAGYSATGGPPISIVIRGTGVPQNLVESTSVAPSYPVGCTVLDASLLDIAPTGSPAYKQGRVLFVPPRLTNASNPQNAVLLSVENVCIIVPTYEAAGTYGASYTLAGTGMKLFGPGNTKSGGANHWQFVNGVDAWGASVLKTKNVNVISSTAAYNTLGDQYAGGGGVNPSGSAAAFVFPQNANQGNLRAETCSTWDVFIGVMIASHFWADQFYTQNAQMSVYMKENGHGARIERLNAQNQYTLVQHLQLGQLTTVLSGAKFDPIGDEYAMCGLSYPASAGASSLYIEQVCIENLFSHFLVDDPSNPLTLVANMDYTGSFSNAVISAGANLIVNQLDIAGNALTTLAGTSAGNVTYTLSGVVPWDKKFLAWLAGYENTTATAQTITFVIPYNHVPAIVKDATGAATVSATTLTLPASMGAPVTGYVILEGY
jgi:hypothetical protein